MREKKGVLQDKGLLSSAQAWFRVAKGLQREGWSEQRVIQSDGNIKYLYHREPPFHCMVNTTSPPPPYKDGSPEPPTAPSDIYIDKETKSTENSKSISDSGQSTIPTDSLIKGGVTPLYPVLTPEGAYYVPVPNLTHIMLSGDEVDGATGGGQMTEGLELLPPLQDFQEQSQRSLGLPQNIKGLPSYRGIRGRTS